MTQRSVRREGVTAIALLLTLGMALTACSSGHVTSHARPAAEEASASPTASPSPTVDPAAQQKAESWLAGAVVPPAAVRSSTQPNGVASGAAPQMWCQPMADAVGYWTLPSMSAADALTWLGTHASQGMQVTSGIGGPASSSTPAAGGTVVDEPSPESLEAIIFTVTTIGSGSGIRADAFTKAADASCATTSDGSARGIGG